MASVATIERTGAQGNGTIRAFVACAGAFAIANATWWMQPFLIEEFSASGRMTLPQIGFALSVEIGMLALVSALASRHLRTGGFRGLALFGGALAGLASLACLAVAGYLPFLLLRALTGAGEGLCLFVANAAITRIGDPDRMFPRLQLTNVVLGIVMVGVLPVARLHLPQPVGLVCLTGVLLLLFPTLLLMPGAMRVAPVAHGVADAGDGTARRARTNIALLSAAILAIGVASGMMWSFYAIIGLRTGLGQAAVDTAIASAIFAAILGSGAAALLGGRLGRAAPISIALLVLAAAILTLSLGPGPLGFRIATAANIAALYFAIPYFFAAGAAQDAGGRGAGVVASAFFLSGAIAPSLGGVLATVLGVVGAGFVVVGAAMLAILLVVFVERRTPRPA